MECGEWMCEECEGWMCEEWRDGCWDNYVMNMCEM